MRKLQILTVACSALIACALFSSQALADFGRPGFQITSTTLPSTLKPGSKGFIALQPLNIGAASTTGSVTVRDVLPAGLTTTAANAGDIGGYSGNALNELSTIIGHTRWACSVAPGEEENSIVTCHNGTGLPSLTGGGGPSTPTEAAGQGRQPSIGIIVSVAGEEGVTRSEQNRMTIEGGGAAGPISASDPVTIGEAAPPFGLARWDGWFSTAEGTLDDQAGSVPYAFTVSFNVAVAKKGTGATKEQKEELLPSGGEFRDLHVNLPAGMVGNPNAVAQCTRQGFDTQPQTCPKTSVIGIARVHTRSVGTSTFQVYNLVAPPGKPALLGFKFESINAFIEPSIRTGSDYGITTETNNSPQKEVLSAEVTLWGVPADPSHNQWRNSQDGGCTPLEVAPGGACTLGPHPSLKPFLTVPSSCSTPQAISETLNGWLSESAAFTEPLSFLSTGGEGAPSGFQDCAAQPFEPSISSTPTSAAADSPTGLDFDLHIPQHAAAAAVEEGGETVGAQTEAATADLKGASVTLPAGLVINPASANGLQACTPAQFGLTSALGVLPVTTTSGPAECPGASQIGSVEVNTPLLDHPLQGGVYVAAPRENPFGSLLAIYIAVNDPQSGVVVKLAGHVFANEQTGQLTASFQNNPQLPFEDFHLSFFSGPAAALRSPSACGTFITTSDMTPWSSPEGADAFPQSSFAITSGANGGACPASEAAEPFAPSFSAGTSEKQAGAFTSLAVSFARQDGEQGLGQVSVTTPPGLSGYISNVPLCGEPQAAQGTCSDASEIGEASTAVGAGSTPYWVNGGKVFLTGPYAGAPYGLSILVPTTAGPYTLTGNGGLGREIVRSAIRIDPLTAQITVQSDPLPSILEGIPLDIRQVNVTINRPDFIFNPTNCTTTLASSATLRSIPGATASASSAFYPAGCKALKFDPRFAPATQAKTSKAGGASLTATLTYPKVPQGTDANVAYVKVELPKQLPSRLTTLQKACTAQVFEANPASCPAASIVGHAVVHTPVLPVPLEGPAYFVSHGGEAFPSLTMVLQGYGVTIELVGTTLIKKGITSTTFKSPPDVPFEDFVLNLPEGPYSALAANANLCTSKLQMPIEYHAQNGATLNAKPTIAVSGCSTALAIQGRKVKGKTLTLTVYVPAAGKLTASGKGLSKASKKAGGREVLTLELKQKQAKKLRTKVKLSFVPAAKGGRKLAKAVMARLG